LSAHEIAALLRLRTRHAPATSANPDVVALQKVGLVQSVASKTGAAFALTAAGRMVLRALGADRQLAGYQSAEPR